MQTACLRLMGKKLLVALIIEDQVAGEGLQNIDEDGDILSAMARELVERNGIVESTDALWKAQNTERQRLFPMSPPEPQDETEKPSPMFIFGRSPARFWGERLKNQDQPFPGASLIIQLN